MTITELLVGVIAVAGALYAINARELMRGVVGLAVFFIAIAGLFATLGAWYLAAAQPLVFVGGVVTLFVLSFQASSERMPQRAVLGIVLSLAVAISISIFLPAMSASMTDPVMVAGVLFIKYGWVINIGLLVLASALFTTQYLLEEQ